MKNCPNGKWEAFLVEANPQFTKELKALEENFPGQAGRSYGSNCAAKKSEKWTGTATNDNDIHRYADMLYICENCLILDLKSWLNKSD